MIVPSLWQWGFMVLCGILMLITVISFVKLMQTVRVSVVMGTAAGVMMAGTSSYQQGREYIGMILIVGSILLLMRAEFRDSI